MKKISVLFLCTHNSARSQMAEAFLRTFYGDRFESYSAGVTPTRVNPNAIEVMKEIGIDISKHQTKSIEQFRGRTFDYVITVCDNAQKTCPFFPGKTLMHHGFDDPSAVLGSPEEVLFVFRRVRDEIKEWILTQFGQLRTQSNEKNLGINSININFIKK